MQQMETRAKTRTNELCNEIQPEILRQGNKGKAKRNAGTGGRAVGN